MFPCFSEIETRIHRLMEQQETVLVAIEGSCTAGKTTLARLLEERFDCNVFHMDDFFLQNHQRTAERFAQPGGNVDYERFREEVLLPLNRGEAVCFRPFDCQTRQLKEANPMPRKKLNIIEGTYSCHPYFGQPYDLKIFLTVTAETQKDRVLQRPAFLHRSFFDSWIPMEHAYFDAYAIQDGCHMVCSGQEEA